MPTRNISLTREQDAFIDEVVSSGEYQNASEALRDALRALQHRRREDELKLEVLRARLEIGARDLAAGRHVELDDAGLRRFLASAGKRPPARKRGR